MKTDQPMQPQSTTTSQTQTERRVSTSQLVTFVYGTLKSGQRNHDTFCWDAVDIRPATILGRLYALPAGYPALVVPESHNLAHGTADLLADAATQVRIADDLANLTDIHRPDGDWDLVHGEIITFTDPLRDLPPIDRLEGFHPGGPSLYWRVLLPVQVNGAPGCAWTYIMAGCTGGRRLRKGVWP